MTGTIFVSLMGIALPILAGVWLMPRGEGETFINVLITERNPWPALRRGWHYVGGLGAAVRGGHMPAGVTRPSSVRYG
jgi:hypothetical protein